MLRAALVCATLIALAGVAFRGQIKSSAAGLLPRTDSDSQLTGEFRLLEQQLGDAAMHMDTKALERLVGADYALRIGDAPEESVPRASWMATLRPDSQHPYKMESFNQQYVAARKLSDNLMIVSLLHTQKATYSGGDRSGDFYLVDVWKKTGGDWQIIARYSTPVHKN